MNPAPTTTTFGPPSSSRTERERVVERAEHEHAVGQRAGVHPEQHPGRGAGGDHEAVEAERLHASAVAAVDRDLAGVEVEPDGTNPELEVEVEVVVARVRSATPVGVDLAGEQLLRQRRSVVGLVGLRADEDHPPVEALPAQRLRPRAVRRATPRRPPPNATTPPTPFSRARDRGAPTGPDAHRSPSRGAGQGPMLRRTPHLRHEPACGRSFCSGVVSVRRTPTPVC